MNPKVKQALQEVGLTAAVAFLLPLVGYLAGLGALPDNLGAAEAALRAGVLAALVSLGKGGLWYLTGTTILPDQAPSLKGRKVAVKVKD